MDSVGLIFSSTDGPSEGVNDVWAVCCKLYDEAADFLNGPAEIRS